MTDLAAKIESALGDWRSSHCGSCARPFAKSTDWDDLEPGQGEHLCWSGRFDCPFEPLDGESVDAHLARDVIAPLVEAHGREAAAAALKATKSLADDWRKVRCGVTSPGLRRAADELAQAIKADIDEVNRRDYDLNAPWINRAQRSTGAKP